MKPLKVLEGGWRKIKEEEEPGETRDMKYELEGTRWRERKVPAADRGYFELSQEDSVKGVTGP